MYKLTSPTSIFRTSDGASFLADPANTDYTQYLAWLAAGNTPEPYVAPIVLTLPQVVTMRQARLALLAAGFLPTVSAIIANMAGAAGDQARIVWEFSSEVRRDNVVLVNLLPRLGLTTSQIDTLFIEAANM